MRSTDWMKQKKNLWSERIVSSFESQEQPEVRMTVPIPIDSYLASRIQQYPVSWDQPSGWNQKKNWLEWEDIIVIWINDGVCIPDRILILNQTQEQPGSEDDCSDSHHRQRRRKFRQYPEANQMDEAKNISLEWEDNIVICLQRR